jgi:hypothetical protein
MPNKRLPINASIRPLTTRPGKPKSPAGNRKPTTKQTGTTRNQTRTARRPSREGSRGGRLENQIRQPQVGQGASRVGTDGSMRKSLPQIGQRRRSPSGVRDEIITRLTSRSHLRAIRRDALRFLSGIRLLWYQEPAMPRLKRPCVTRKQPGAELAQRRVNKR